MRSQQDGNWWTGGYLTPILVVLFTIFWSLMIYSLIGVRPRDWEYGTVPYVPGQSRFTSHLAPQGPAPHQVVLPETITRGAHAIR